LTRPRFRTRRGGGFAGTAVVVVVLAGVVVATLASPLLFALVLRRSSQWPQLADVGEAYGGAAALLTGLALAGVAASLHMQWRQTRTDRILAIRQRHFELVKLGIDEPLLLDDSATTQSDQATALRQIYANLWVAHWAMLWDLRLCEEPDLRRIAARFFEAGVARDWWSVNGPTWSMTMTRQRSRFQQIFSEECQRARQRAETTRRPAFAPTGDRVGSAARLGTAVAAGVLAGVALGRVLARYANRGGALASEARRRRSWWP